jgi:hypothetical protein
VRTYVNPQILWASTDMIRHEEGSVSMPGVMEEIERHARVRIRIVVAVGLLWRRSGPLRLGRPPGDIVVERVHS